MKLVFVFGSTPQLSLIELASLIPDVSLTSVSLRDLSGALVDLELPKALEICDRLGGTVKLIVLEKTFCDVSSNDLAEYIMETCKDKLNFAVSAINDSKIPTNKLAGEIKEILNSRGIKSRFVLPSTGCQLSSVVVSKQKVFELCVFSSQQEFFVGKTVWVQDFVSWGKRDYDRPAVSGHIGMLPPKVARIMINLSQTAPGDLIYDPFCGVGTVLAESLVCGYSVLGSDLSREQVERTSQNLAWLGETYKGKYVLKVGDAQKADSLFDQKVGAIVTEPDLGPNDLRNGFAKEIKDRLIRLYCSSLVAFRNLLKDGGRVVIALPKPEMDESIVQAVIDKAEAMGYSLQGQPVEYFRPGANVRRMICIFNFKSKV